MRKLLMLSLTTGLALAACTSKPTTPEGQRPNVVDLKPGQKIEGSYLVFFKKNLATTQTMAQQMDQLISKYGLQVTSRAEHLGAISITNASKELVKQLRAEASVDGIGSDIALGGIPGLDQKALQEAVDAGAGISAQATVQRCPMNMAYIGIRCADWTDKALNKPYFDKLELMGKTTTIFTVGTGVQKHYQMSQQFQNSLSQNFLPITPGNPVFDLHFGTHKSALPPEGLPTDDAVGGQTQEAGVAVARLRNGPTMMTWPSYKDGNDTAVNWTYGVAQGANMASYKMIDYRGSCAGLGGGGANGCLPELMDAIELLMSKNIGQPRIMLLAFQAGQYDFDICGDPAAPTPGEDPYVYDALHQLMSRAWEDDIFLVTGAGDNISRAETFAPGGYCAQDKSLHGPVFTVASAAIGHHNIYRNALNNPGKGRTIVLSVTSNYGPGYEGEGAAFDRPVIDLAAPGGLCDPVSAEPFNDDITVLGSSKAFAPGFWDVAKPVKYALDCGTYIAAAHVAGAAAVELSRNPGLTSEEVSDIIYTKATTPPNADNPFNTNKYLPRFQNWVTHSDGYNDQNVPGNQLDSSTCKGADVVPQTFCSFNYPILYVGETGPVPGRPAVAAPGVAGYPG